MGNFGRFCHNLRAFMWRKIEPKKYICGEKMTNMRCVSLFTWPSLASCPPTIQQPNNPTIQQSNNPTTQQSNNPIESFKIFCFLVHLTKLGVLSSNNPGGHGHPASIVLRQRAPGDHRCLFVFVLFLYILCNSRLSAARIMPHHPRHCQLYS